MQINWVSGIGAGTYQPNGYYQLDGDTPQTITEGGTFEKQGTQLYTKSPLYVSPCGAWITSGNQYTYYATSHYTDWTGGGDCVHGVYLSKYLHIVARKGGSFLGNVYSYDPSAYPEGESTDGYWYVFVG